jgi:hypothetical protein
MSRAECRAGRAALVFRTQALCATPPPRTGVPSPAAPDFLIGERDPANPFQSER